MTATRKSAGLLVICLLIGHLGWIKFSYPAYTYAIDYAQHIVIIALYVLAFHSLDLHPIARRSFIYAAFGAAFAIFLGDVTLHWSMIKFGVPLKGDRFPPSSDWLRLFDVTLGVVLVALAEELVYRKLMADVIGRMTDRALPVYLISAVAFAALHVNQGVVTTLNAFVAGLILMRLYRWSGRLFVPVLAHYLADFIFFGFPGLKPALLKLWL